MLTDGEERARLGRIADDIRASQRKEHPQSKGSAASNGAGQSARPAVNRAVGADLLDSVRAFIGRFVAFPSDHCLNAVSLWVAHTHMIEHFHTTPRLALLSHEPESGKTRVLEILGLLTPNPMLMFSPSTATIFRQLAQCQMTLLFDEVDTIFPKYINKDDANEPLRALLNAGYRRGASIPRCVGPRHDVVQFEVFAAAALAGLGDLPATIMTRAIVINMKRRRACDPVEPFRYKWHEPQGNALRDQLGEWGAEVAARAGDANPDLPPGIEDRKAEQWEPLIAIADEAGGDWPEFARAAASAALVESATQISLGVRLLRDVKEVFGDRDKMFTEDIINELLNLEDGTWRNLKSGPIDADGLKRRLQKYGVERSKTTVRVGEEVLKGYYRKDLTDAWDRYLRDAPSPKEPVTPVTPVTPTETHVTRVTPVTAFPGRSACRRCEGEGCRWCSLPNATDD